MDIDRIRQIAKAASRGFTVPVKTSQIADNPEDAEMLISALERRLGGKLPRSLADPIRLAETSEDFRTAGDDAIRFVDENGEPNFFDRNDWQGERNLFLSPEIRRYLDDPTGHDRLPSHETLKKDFETEGDLRSKINSIMAGSSQLFGRQGIQPGGDRFAQTEAIDSIFNAGNAAMSQISGNQTENPAGGTAAQFDLEAARQAWNNFFAQLGLSTDEQKGQYLAANPEVNAKYQQALNLKNQTSQRTAGTTWKQAKAYSPLNAALYSKYYAQEIPQEQQQSLDHDLQTPELDEEIPEEMDDPKDLLDRIGSLIDAMDGEPDPEISEIVLRLIERLEKAVQDPFSEEEAQARALDNEQNVMPRTALRREAYNFEFPVKMNDDRRGTWMSAHSLSCDKCGKKKKFVVKSQSPRENSKSSVICPDCLKKEGHVRMQEEFRAKILRDNAEMARTAAWGIDHSDTGVVHFLQSKSPEELQNLLREADERIAREPRPAFHIARQHIVEALEKHGIHIQ